MFSVVIMIALMGFWQADGYIMDYMNERSVPGKCPGQFKESAGICYYFSSSNNEMVTWAKAKERCKEIGGGLGAEYTVGLAELNFERTWKSDGEMLQKIAKTDKNHWLGAKGTDRTWTWATSGRPLALENYAWSIKAPNPLGADNCLVAIVEILSGSTIKRAYIGNNVCNMTEGIHHFVCQLF
ncbi:unnamed protein product [Meganyctiphanes norvegica]|uniref:C-type lectin domain-containing protein n=1 Tax=Meganyctiphanes norvegica TaxID=48144 RepID=A0AAV2QKX6_MEGNR